MPMSKGSRMVAGVAAGRWTVRLRAEPFTAHAVFGDLLEDVLGPEVDVGDDRAPQAVKELGGGVLLEQADLARVLLRVEQGQYEAARHAKRECRESIDV